MLLPLAVLVLVLTALDHWTTYVCLQASVKGWLVTEGNPLAAWLFDRFGLVEGLAIDTLVTLAAVAFVARTDLLGAHAKLACLGLLAATTAYAVTNNLGAVHALGLSLLGGNGGGIAG